MRQFWKVRGGEGEKRRDVRGGGVSVVGVCVGCQVVHSFSEEQKKRLLFFVTGSDRVPIKGLADLVFVISRNGKEREACREAGRGWEMGEGVRGVHMGGSVGRI